MKKNTIDDINNIVAEYYNILANKLREKTRKRNICFCRQVSIYLISKHTRYTSFDIADYYCVNRSNISNSKKTIQNLIDTDKKIKTEIEEIEKKYLTLINDISVEKKSYCILKKIIDYNKVSGKIFNIKIDNNKNILNISINDNNFHIDIFEGTYSNIINHLYDYFN